MGWIWVVGPAWDFCEANDDSHENPETSMARFLFSLPKKRRFYIFGRVVPRSTTPKSPVSGIKAWKITRDFFWFYATAKRWFRHHINNWRCKNYAPFAVWKRYPSPASSTTTVVWQRHLAVWVRASSHLSSVSYHPDLHCTELSKLRPIRSSSSSSAQAPSSASQAQCTLVLHVRTKFHDGSLGANRLARVKCHRVPAGFPELLRLHRAPIRSSDFLTLSSTWLSAASDLFSQTPPMLHRDSASFK